MKRLNITTIIIICNIIITRMMGSWISRRMMGSSVARPGYQSLAHYLISHIRPSRNFYVWIIIQYRISIVIDNQCINNLHNDRVTNKLNKFICPYFYFFIFINQCLSKKIPSCASTIISLILYTIIYTICLQLYYYSNNIKHINFVI